MATIVEILGATVASHASNGNNVGQASTVKVVAGSAANLELHTASKAALLGTVCMAAGETMYITKGYNSRVRQHLIMLHLGSFLQLIHQANVQGNRVTTNRSTLLPLCDASVLRCTHCS